MIECYATDQWTIAKFSLSRFAVLDLTRVPAGATAVHQRFELQTAWPI